MSEFGLFAMLIAKKGRPYGACRMLIIALAPGPVRAFRRHIGEHQQKLIMVRCPAEGSVDGLDDERFVILCQRMKPTLDSGS